MFKNKTILITGGSGTIGQAMTKYLLDHDAKKVIVYSRGEMLQYEMANKFKSDKIRYFIGDVRDKDRLTMAMRGVDYVVHAAALKQVPACEYNPNEAIKTNVLGAMSVIDAAIENKVKKVIALSTDKAVSPINIYGATKLCSDKLFISSNNLSPEKNRTIFAVVRYGNVSGSRGSVKPFFQHLCDTAPVIKEGDTVKRIKPCLPVTDARMTRFDISIDQGVALIAKAFKESKGGEIYVAKIPSYRILDLVKHFGCEAKIIGIRPGEKLHEIMITSDDALRTYEQKDCYIIYPDIHDWTEKIKPKGRKVKYGFQYSSDNNKEWLYK